MLSLLNRKKNKDGILGIDFLVVGLGNPGIKYEESRHNAGFMAIDLLAKKYNANINRVKFKGLTGKCEIKSKNVVLLKPSTFMNLSGESVYEAMKFYKLPPEKILIIFDDISLSPGRIRIKRKGTHGGQNGMKNIINVCSSEDFPRIKIGIGAKPHPKYDLAAWVLSKFTDSEKKDLQTALDNACSSVEYIVSGNIDYAMSEYNGI